MTLAIWAWVLAAYDQPGVPEATLALQDNHGQNTSYLLWAVYARATDRSLLGRAAATARAWDQTALIPIRQARRALKTPLPPINDGAREAFDGFDPEKVAAFSTTTSNGSPPTRASCATARRSRRQ